MAVVTTSAVDAPDLDRLTRLGRNPSAVTLVAFEGRRPRSEAAPWPAVGHVVVVPVNRSFAAAWDATLSVGGPGLRPAARR